MTLQELKDKSNPKWKSTWKRKQKRTTEDSPVVETVPDTTREEVLSMIPLSAKNNSPVSPVDFTNLLKALEYYVKSCPCSFSIERFIVDFTQLEPDFISHYIDNHGEDENISVWQKLYTRTRLVVESNITSMHVLNNPQFAMFYVKNKHGYVDKTEQSVSQSVGIQVISNVPMPDPPPKLKE